MRKGKFLICMLLVLALVIAIPAAIFANDSASDAADVPDYGGNIYNAGTVNIASGTVSGGVARHGGNIYNAKTGSLTVSGAGKILDGIAYVLGANIYVANGSNYVLGGQISINGESDDGVYAPTHSTCICGSKTSKHAEGCDGEKDSIVWQEWTSANSLPTETGYWYLAGDVVLNEAANIMKGSESVNVVLDLNGNTVYRSAAARIFNMNQGSLNRLTILDSKGDGRIELGSTTDSLGCLALIGGSNGITIYGGTVNGARVKHTNASAPGAIIRVAGTNTNANVNIHGGTIIGGTAVNFGGGAIGMSIGTLNMTAGEIKDGTAKFGGNIYLAAGTTANLSGTAAVTGGTATGNGYTDSGNIYIEENATLNMGDINVDGVYREGNVLSVGYGIAEITPKENWQVATGGDNSIIKDKSAINPIYAVSVYMVDSQGNEYLNVVVDLSTAGLADNRENGLGIGDEVRDIALSEFGLDAKYVTVAGTHAHASVSYSSNLTNVVDQTQAWRQNELRNGIITSIQQAKDDASPVTGMYTGSTETENMTFVRRYTTSSPNYTNGYYDGFKENASGVPNDLIHESDADEEIQLIKITREGGKDIVMVNWQTHATLTDNLAIISSDFIGSLRDTVASGLNAHCVFYQGACGNLAPTSLIKNESKYKASLASALQLGKDVAAYVVGFNDYTEVKTGGIQVNQQQITDSLSSKVTDEMLIAVATEVYNYGNTKGYVAANQYIIDNNYDDTYGLETYQHAKEIVEARSGNMPTYKAYEINSVSIGDVAFITLPMELSDVTGKQLKECSDFDTVMLIGYSCGKGKYVMHDAAYEHGGYETYCSYFQRGEAEKLVGLYDAVLDKLYTSRY